MGMVESHANTCNLFTRHTSLQNKLRKFSYKIFIYETLRISLCHQFILITPTPHSHSSLPLLTPTPHSHSSLSLLTLTPHSSLSLLTLTPHSHSSLSLSLLIIVCVRPTPNSKSCKYCGKKGPVRYVMSMKYWASSET
jgi:hypothetical protein